MIEETVKLSFRGPFGLAGDHEKILFHVPEAKQKGLYLFAVPYAHGGFLLTYIGETSTSFFRRAKEHMIQTMGGNYRISEPTQLTLGVDVVLWNGLWRKGTRDNMSGFLDSLPELAPIIQKYLRSQVIFTASFDGDKRDRRRIEGALARHFRELGAPAGALLPDDIRYNQRKESEEPVRVLIECPLVYGMPEELKA